MSDLNSFTITGNLCADPELRAFPSGGHVCRLRVAVNGGYTSRETNEWVEKPNFFDVEVFNGAAENAAKHLSKGRKIGAQGRLDYQEWEDKETGAKRSKVVLRAAGGISFLDSPNKSAEDRDDAPAPVEATQPAGTIGSDDDIPF